MALLGKDGKQDTGSKRFLGLCTLCLWNQRRAEASLPPCFHGNPVRVEESSESCECRASLTLSLSLRLHWKAFQRAHQSQSRPSLIHPSPRFSLQSIRKRLHAKMGCGNSSATSTTAGGECKCESQLITAVLSMDLCVCVPRTARFKWAFDF